MESSIKIMRSKRRTLALTVNHEGVVVIKAPQKMANGQILDFVEQKKRWIQKNIEKAINTKAKTATLNISKEKIDIIKKRALEVLIDEVKKSANQMKLEPLQIKTTSASTMWGSCTSDNVIRLNWRLLLVPQECREYVIIHELAHIEHKNHSKDFWLLVEQYCQDYKELRQKLKEYSYLLRSV